jgi:hypothetical protein
MNKRSRVLRGVPALLVGAELQLDDTGQEIARGR